MKYVKILLPVLLLVAFIALAIDQKVGQGNEARQKGIVRIDCDSDQFDPSFLGKGWTVAQEDDHALGIKRFIPADLVLLRRESKENNGEIELSLLKGEGWVLANANIFKALWYNQRLIPEECKFKARPVYFGGTILHDRNKKPHILNIYWSERDDQYMWSLSNLASSGNFVGSFLAFPK